jgi:hypothetical protein
VSVAPCRATVLDEVAGRAPRHPAASCHVARVVSAHRWLSAEAIDRAGNARRGILALWARHGDDVVSPLASPSAETGVKQQLDQNADRAERCSRDARTLMDQFRLTPQVARDDDITHALGDALEKLLIMLVPLKPAATGTAAGGDNAAYVERLLLMAARAQYEIPIRTVQHVFARTATYAEALTLFHLFRTCHVRMNMHAYYAMVQCLQRLEEESWALRFREEFDERVRTVAATTAGGASAAAAGSEEVSDGAALAPEAAAAPSLQALEFILRGCEGQLLPEAKPWLGRVAFADAGEGVAPTRTSDYDALGATWAQRFRGQHSAHAAEAAPAARGSARGVNA